MTHSHGNKIAFLPLDGRPPNCKFVRQIAGICGSDLHMPDVRIFGTLKDKTDMNAVSRWLLNGKYPEYIISVDALVYGGLVASRENGKDTDKCLQSLEILDRIKKLYPDCRLKCFNVIRRISSTVKNENDMAEYENLLSYFKKIADGENPVKDEIPNSVNADYLDGYFSLRRRNHLINKKCLHYANNGIIDCLALVQEDCFPGGPQKKEREVLRRLADPEKYGVGIFMHDGTDEAGQEMVISSLIPDAYGINVFCDDGAVIGRIHEYEDEKFESNLFSHAGLMNINIMENIKCGNVLYISGRDAEKTLEDIKVLLEENRNVVLLDLFRANGGNCGLLSALEKHGIIGKLAGYSSWNTACNALGTALSQVKMAACEFTDKRLLRRFCVERLIDDGFYQGQFRQLLRKTIEDAGLDPNYSDFSSHPAVKKCILDFENGMNSFILRNFPEFSEKKIVISFPWKRIFECELNWE